jgi:outer membrane protein assembly factor BamB
MKTLLIASLSALVVAVGQAADGLLVWPQFRGPNGSGLADGQRPPIELGPEKNVKWKIPVPSGLSSPVIVGSKLVITAFDDDKLFTIAYNRADGKEAWRALAPAEKIEPFLKSDGSPAASTCATDGERVVSYFGSFGLICYDSTGKELWKFPMEMSQVGGNFGTGASPIISDGAVIVVRDEAKDARIIAVDLASGKLRWERKRQSPVSYCTPIVWDASPTQARSASEGSAGGKQVVAAGHGRMVGYDLKTGAEKWFVAGMPSGCCASPVIAGGTLFFAGWSPGGPDDKENQMPTFDANLKQLDTDKDGSLSRAEAEKAFAGFFDTQDTNKDGQITREEYDVILKFMADGKSSAFALRSGGSGDVTSSHMLWQQTKGLPYIASAIVVRGQYVMIKDGGIVTAYDAQTGKEIYMQRAAAAGKYYASPVAANDAIYFTSLEDGTITVLKAGTNKPEVLAQNPKLDERVGATPAIADNTLYVRTEKHLYAFAEPK